MVYDSVGKDTFPRSLECTKPFGFWIGYGQSSGRPPPFDMTLLQKRWLYVGRQALQPHIATRAGLEALAGDLFAAITAGIFARRSARNSPSQKWRTHTVR